MGAWGIHTFESDSSLDWIGGFRENASEEKILAAFRPTIVEKRTGFFAKLTGAYQPERIEFLDGEDVLGAAEVVAALLGHPSPFANGALDDLPKVRITLETLIRAEAALDDILLSSDLKGLWEDTSDYSAWVADVRAIQQRLRIARAEQDAAGQSAAGE